MRIPAAALLMLCTTSASNAQGTVDHIILGVSDLKAGIEQIHRQTGVRPIYGGAHPGGTHNALIALGAGTYLELLAPNPDSPNFAKQRGELDRYKTPTPIGWAIGTEEPNALRRQLVRAGFEVTKPQPGSRRREDGSILRWQTFELSRPEDAVTPFFIQWLDASQHPSLTAVQGCSLSKLRASDPNPPALQRLFRLIGVKIPVAQGPTRLRVVLNCPTGEVAY